MDNVTAHCAAHDDDTPANTVLQLHVNVSLSRPKRCVAHLVVHRTGGSTSYETNDSPVPLETSGGVCLLSTVDMVVQRRDGPRRRYATVRAVNASLGIASHTSPLEHSNSRFELIRFVMRIDLNRFVL